MKVPQITVVEIGSDKEVDQSDSCPGRQTIGSNKISMDKSEIRY